MAKRRLPLVLSGLLLVCFLGGVAQILRLRMDQGDTFPAYSTFRADPMGSKALYESLASLRGVRVNRNFVPVERMREPKGALLVLGTPAGVFLATPRNTLQQLRNWATHGSRVIISFRPLERGESAKFAGEAGHELGFEVSTEPGKDPRDRVLYFSNLNREWTVLSFARDHPRIISHPYGTGAIVLCADSYLFSNEAILNTRQTRLIAQIFGDSRDILFDESHHEIYEEPSIGTLARRYRLHGFVAGLLLLAGLFLWKSGAGFLPALADDDRLDSVSGKDTASGLVKLLKRSVPSSELGAVCIAEWKKSPQLVERCGKPALRRIEQAVLENNNPVEAYRAVQQILAERN